jgi:hypothetical protein
MERVLTQRELNRALLARQGLLERRRDSLPRTLERVGGIQAQYAPSMYVGLWSRMASLERAAVTRALERRTAIQGTLMRVTIHLVSARDYWPFALGVREPRRAGWLRAHRGHPTDAEARAVAAKVAERLEAGPVTRAELLEEMDTPLLNSLQVYLDLVRVPPSGTWERRRADLFQSATSWLGPPEGTDDDGREHLVRRYLQAFGPAAPADIASWAGIPVRPISAAVERIELRRFRDEEGRTLVDLPRLPLPSGDAPAPARFLPTWDATLLVHCRRTQILPEEHRPRVFSIRTPQSVSTFLVDGAVAGTWRHEDGRVRLEPFGRLTRDARAELEEEGERLAAYMA